MALKYSKKEQINLKVKGMLTVTDSTVTIDVDGTDKDIKNLVADFDRTEVALSVSTSIEEELELPDEELILE